MIQNLSSELDWIHQTKPHVPSKQSIDSVLLKRQEKLSSSTSSNTSFIPRSSPITQVNHTTDSDGNKENSMIVKKGNSTRRCEPVMPLRSVDTNSQEDIIDLTFESTSPLKKRTDKRTRSVEVEVCAKRQRKPMELSFDQCQRLIILQQEKITLLETKFKTSESTSISLDEKLKIFKQIQNEIEKVDEEIERLKTVSPIDQARDIISQIQPVGQQQVMQQSIEQVGDSLITIETEQFTNTIPEPIPRPESTRQRELRQQGFPRQGFPQLGLPRVEQSDVEDDFGEHTMDGLLTPTQDRDDQYDDEIRDFIDDDSILESTYSDSNDEEVRGNTSSIVEDIRLSPDTANKMGIIYDPEEEEEIDVDFGTQLNEEREIDIIEIFDEEEEEVEAQDKRGELIKKLSPFKYDDVEVPQIDLFSSPKSDNYDFSDDEELISIMNNKVIPGSEPFIDEIHQVLNTTFKLKSFRSNQLEAIVSTLLGKDTFVLMPTGGGKSLCYQLPALIQGGKTKGTTIVISPLISLMQDQVQHLVDKNIKAGMISSKANSSENKNTIDLFKENLLDIVYLSPEKANKSAMIQKIIGNLYEQDQLARVVIDEAHCLSSWGHDFRPDYKGMSFFKSKFPKVPIMALTATANEKVTMDIIHHLKMQEPKFLKQSFNRTNLYYEIKWKNGNFIESIKNYIESKFKGKTGIIYCHSKNSCEQTAAKLSEYGLKCSFYHAGMSPDDRFRIQSLWQQGQIQVICATIAFGMGIDKSDVRFVIHLFIPRSLEGYYQETGRAGRDGNLSECIMYYSYKDARTLQGMIQRDEELTEEGKENHVAKLRQVVQYCENKTDCRRKQVLQYFNEQFNPVDCKGQCDNCKNYTHGSIIEKDVTEYAKDIIKLVKSIYKQKVTILHCQDVFKGLNHSKINKMGHNTNEYHGKGKSLDKTDIERIFFYLLSEQCLQEYQLMKSGFASTYVSLGKNANIVLKGEKRIKIMFNS